MMYGLEVGAIVRMPARPDWGEGQVQSIDDRRVTVTFEHSGKQVLLSDTVELELLSGDTT